MRDEPPRDSTKGTFLRRVGAWPFTLFGLFTLAVFVAIALSGGPGVGAFGPLLRVLIIPIYVMRLVVVGVGRMLFDHGFPVWYEILTLPVSLLPYIVLDGALRLMRRSEA